MTPKDFHTLIEKALVTPKERAEAWRLYKEVSPDAGVTFMQNIERYFTKLRSELKLKDTPVPYKIWGQEHIEQGAIDQMIHSARLPISVAGALMPDAHQGYGLPIGGVLATDNAVIPYAVGVDIACRMMLTVYPTDSCILHNPKSSEYALLEKALLENTIFGSRSEGIHDGKIDHPILDKNNWQTTPLIKSLHLTATRQIGTSGTGNHFVEWGEVTIKDANNPLHLKPGSYLALLSHSGSRGVGFKIADHYTKLAMAQMPNLDDAVKHLAWLDLSREAGQEYWDAMELAGKFASANHHIIHQRVAKASGLTPIATVENHHNFAWRETIQINGKAKDVIVHRKGATPAGQGVLGIIPGTMADTGYIVSGKGNPESLHSASHGGGRLMSRRNAIKTISAHDQAAYLTKRGVKLHGGGLDEAPQAYKQIEKVIAAQSDLVDIIG
ncbi:MAG: RtcB family protein, partial [Chlamydiales bacterium]|nr:RtcB family protein [Chlamydiales bacterium]